MKRKILLGTLAIVGFLIACAGVATMQMIIGGFMPNDAPDPAAKLEPSPEDKAKQQWEQEQKQSATTEAKAPASTPEPTPTPTPQPTSQPTPTPTPEPQQTYTPPQPALTVGPGNFDAPQPYYPPPGATGPGNM